MSDNLIKLMQKTVMLITLFTTLSLSHVVKAQDDDEGDLWVQPIEVINIAARKMIVGDLEVNLTPNFKVYDQSGKSLSRSVLKPGVVIKAVLEYRREGVFVSNITLNE